MRKRKLMFTLLAAATLMVNTSVWAGSDSEIENYTRYTDYEPQPAEPVGLIPGENHKILVAWFSRVGNTVFDPDVDAVTTPRCSMMKTENCRAMHR